jgi:hypothetical protein
MNEPLTSKTGVDLLLKAALDAKNLIADDLDKARAEIERLSRAVQLNEAHPRVLAENARLHAALQRISDGPKDANGDKITNLASCIDWCIAIADKAIGKRK